MNNTSNIQYCKDCKHAKVSLFERLFIGWGFAKCAVHLEKPVDLIDPEDPNSRRFCTIVREWEYHNSLTCPKFEKK